MCPAKEDTNRIAIATGNIFAEHETLVLIKEGTAKKRRCSWHC